jgi:hypothetical protein
VRATQKNQVRTGSAILLAELNRKSVVAGTEVPKSGSPILVFQEFALNFSQFHRAALPSRQRDEAEVLPYPLNLPLTLKRGKRALESDIDALATNAGGLHDALNPLLA